MISALLNGAIEVLLFSELISSTFFALHDFAKCICSRNMIGVEVFGRRFMFSPTKIPNIAYLFVCFILLYGQNAR